MGVGVGSVLFYFILEVGEICKRACARIFERVAKCGFTCAIAIIC